MADSRVELLRKWILNANPEITELDDDTDIIDSRIVTSLQFVSFIIYLEEVRGGVIDPDHLDIDSLRTLRAIEKNYLSPTAPPARPI
jgi:acyl carrier protein